MKVKANYGISCDRGYFETGETFDIEEKDLPMYGDAVTVMDSPPVPVGAVPEEEPPANDPEAAPETAGAEPPKTVRARKRKA